MQSAAAVRCCRRVVPPWRAVLLQSVRCQRERAPAGGTSACMQEAVRRPTQASLPEYVDIRSTHAAGCGCQSALHLSDAWMAKPVFACCLTEPPTFAGLRHAWWDSPHAGQQPELTQGSLAVKPGLGHALRHSTAPPGACAGTTLPEHPRPARQGLCIPPCPEVTIGLYLYRLILTNCVSINLVDILVTSLRKLMRQAAIYDSPSVRRPGVLAGRALGMHRVSARVTWIGRLWQETSQGARTEQASCMCCCAGHHDSFRAPCADVAGRRGLATNARAGRPT